MTECDTNCAKLQTAMSILADNFIDQVQTDAVLASVTTLAVELIDAVDFADVLLIDEQSYRSIAPTSHLATEVDALQIEANEGPCLSAAMSDGVVCSVDLKSEKRWPRFTPAAVKAGVQSMLSFKLYADPPGKSRLRNRGAFNTFSCTPHEFTPEERTIGALLATHAASALIAAERERHLHSAIESRDTIGQAKGVLMERFSIDADSAFSLMRRLSQQTNTPLRDIAHDIVKTPRG